MKEKCPHLRTHIEEQAVICLDCGLIIVRPYDPVLKIGEKHGYEN